MKLNAARPIPRIIDESGMLLHDYEQVDEMMWKHLRGLVSQLGKAVGLKRF